MAIGRMLKNLIGYVDDPFARDTTSLPEVVAPAVVTLDDGDIFELQAAPVRKRLGNVTVKMLGYNGSVPGPTLRVRQGSELTVRFANEMELATTVHWHGLRLDNRFDGVPVGAHHGMQAPIPPAGNFTYHLRFPDPGLYWYHPHIREDYAQEHGLYGNIIVVPSAPDYWAPVNRELTLVLDDILIERGKIAAFSQSLPNRTAMGRFGNVMLINGDTDYQLEARQGEVIRFYLTNTANVRVFNLHLPGARLKLVGGDNGRIEHEQFVESVLIAPSERVIMDVLFEQAGQVMLEHRTPRQSYRLGMIQVSDEPAGPSCAQAFTVLRHNHEFPAERARIAADLVRPLDKTLTLIGDMGHGGHPHGGHVPEDIEWEDTMAWMNRISTPDNMHWKLVDEATGAENHAIQWAFAAGDRVKIRIINTPHSDHPMQHPIHFHGQRFLVLSRNGVPNDNLVWKDTVLLVTGETVDILLDASNPGAWMAHCHIAEHVESGMMLTYHVGTAHQVEHDEAMRSGVHGQHET